jgi:hypothetical protein
LAPWNSILQNFGSKADAELVLLKVTAPLPLDMIWGPLKPMNSSRFLAVLIMVEMSMKEPELAKVVMALHWPETRRVLNDKINMNKAI